MAVLLGEAGADDLERLLLDHAVKMSAATRVELGIVVEGRVGPAGSQLLDELLDRIGVRIIDVDAAQARQAIVAWRTYGKGRHPAALDYGDTFSYALSMSELEPLLFVGDDFAQTDVLRV